MAPPTFTPSPHRFLTQPRAPPSSLRTVQRPLATTTSSSSQFAPTPRFSLSSIRLEQPDDAILPSSSPPASTSPLVSRPRPHVRLRRGEEIEDSDQEEKGGRAGHERESVSADRVGEMRPDDDDERRAARGHKRRRLSIESWGHEGREYVHGGEPTTARQREVIAISSSPPSSPSPSPSPSDTAQPQQRAINPNPGLSLPLPITTATTTIAKSTTAPSPSHAPQFLLPTPSFSFSIPPTTPQTAPSPSIFLLPPAQPPSPTSHEPLPELFSPHRRGQKFLPDGLAATVRDWVVEVGSRGRNQSQGGGRGRGQRHGDWGESEGEGEVRMRVLEVWGGGNVVLVRGMMGLGTGEESGRKWMLMGGGGSGAEVRTGVVVVVRAPVWEVDVRGERWGVGVEWRVGGGGGGGG